ncbi:MAG: GTPase domain-containing protein [Flavobacterium sp.]|nr:GTPase domain-containing protein [Flavobacterium sp.]
MTEPLSWGAIFSAAKAGHAIIDEKKRNVFIKKLNLLFRSNRKIVVFGLSGAGKSQFINCLKKNLIIAERTDTTEKIKFELDKFPIQFIDTPGQAGRHYPRKEELTKILKNGVEGIVNVISYGYEENPEFSFDDIFTPTKEVKESFLKLNRKAEVERLAEWLPLIHPNDIGWIINLVNKADLWWDNLDDVQKYYNKEDYNDAFKQIDNYTNVVTLPFCAIIKPYYDTKTSGKFGEIQKEQMHNHFTHQLLNLLKED